MTPIRVFIIDDSALVRKLLTEFLDAATDIEIIGSAADPILAERKIKKLQPDVLICDIEMPKMDGITFLKKQMREAPIPTIICSALVSDGNRKMLEALEAGAVDVIAKPQRALKDFFHESVILFTDKIKAAYRTNLSLLARSSRQRPYPESKPPLPSRYHESPILIGASTGGTQALKEILISLPADLPPIIIVQHMPENFTRAYAESLDKYCTLSITEAVNGEKLQRGRVLIAPGNKHLIIRKGTNGTFVEIKGGQLVSRHRPSVDILFRSGADVFGSRSIGILLTGMGRDGAEGLKLLRDKGALTLAQDEATSVVYGMPKVAADLGAACAVLPLDKLAGIIANPQLISKGDIHVKTYSDCR